MVELNNISLSYGKEEILKEINIKIKEGECILLTGESGSGKSSIIKSINGLATKYEEGVLSGEVLISGKNIVDLELFQMSMMISSVFQNPKTHFFNVNTTLELLFYLENIGLSREEIDRRMEEMLLIFPIKHLLNRDIFKLSGGEKQILCVASAYISGCKIIVLDESSSNLDEIYIDILSNMLNTLKEKGITLILAEHRIYYLMDVVDRIFLIQKGKVLSEYTKYEFLKISENNLEQLGIRPFSKTKLNTGESFENKNPTLPRCFVSGEYSETLLFHNKKDLIIKKLLYPIGNGKKLEIKDIKFNFGKIYGIVGKNGCGKSTFSRCFIGLERKCEDEIYLNGKKLSKKERLKNSSLVMQDVNHQLFSDSVEEEVKLGIKELNQTRIDDVLDELNLSEFKTKHPMSLSGGQKQRVAVASVICKDSKFVFFDEPTSGMDYKNMVKISGLIKKMKKQNNIIFIISHDNEFLNMTVDEVINMEGYQV